MIIIGLDPGCSTPRHVRLDTLHVTVAPQWPAHRVWLEGQHVGRIPGTNRRVSHQTVMTLSLYAGLHAGAYLATGAEVWQIPVRVWRGYFDSREQNLSKEVWQNRYRRGTPVQIWQHGPDATDAYWIGVVGERLYAERTKAELKRLKVKRLKWTN